jgi:hypothetical protein
MVKHSKECKQYNNRLRDENNRPIKDKSFIRLRAEHFHQPLPRKHQKTIKIEIDYKVRKGILEGPPWWIHLIWIQWCEREGYTYRYIK